MQVKHFTFSRSGGAGVVAERLTNGQLAAGIDAQLFTVTDTNLYRDPFSRPLLTSAAIADNLLVSNHSSPNIISLFRGKIGLLSNEVRRTHGLLHFHWMKGLVTKDDLLEISRVKSRAVWTLHDMAPFTSVCHHAHACTSYERNCESCPQVVGLFKKAVSRNFIELREAERFFADTIFTAPSLWMFEKAKKSYLLRNSRIELVSNPVDDTFFATRDQIRLRLDKGISESAFVVLCVAANLADPNKGIQQSVDIFRSVSKALPNREMKLILVGENANHLRLGDERNILKLGSQSQESLADILSMSDVLLFPSRADTAPLVVLEAIAAGTSVIAIQGTGADYFLGNHPSGYLASDFVDFEKTASRHGSKKINRTHTGLKN